MGVDTGGAGDQGLMFGYACNETAELMPLPIMLAHKLARGLSSCAATARLACLRPDGKSQVTRRIRRHPSRFASTPSSSRASTARKVSQDTMREDVTEKIIKPASPAEPDGQEHEDLRQPDRTIRRRRSARRCRCHRTQDHRRHLRRMRRHGGGAFSGKDPTKVDRSACYMARYVAKNIVAAGLADRATVQLAYADRRRRARCRSWSDAERLGQRSPSRRSPNCVRANFKLTPRGIHEELNLRRPIYRRPPRSATSAAPSREFSWEKTDKAAALKKGARL